MSLIAFGQSPLLLSRVEKNKQGETVIHIDATKLSMDEFASLARALAAPPKSNNPVIRALDWLADKLG